MRINSSKKQCLNMLPGSRQWSSYCCLKGKNSISIIFFILILFCGSCAKADLTVRSEYYSRSSLASTYVDTPDPNKESTAFGQRLAISWSVLPPIFEQGPLVLELVVRLKNGEEKTAKITLKRHEGRIFYPIVGTDFTKKGGLQSYFVKLISNGKVLAKSKHKFWVENIALVSVPT